ncbi:hypothetical protein [Gandjariella thermophila]|uniref:Uncharacterized protein n=1 Tax=Gandjariella thermophila TaxID=1931992 RepID=A0A4D4JJD5_9PSEU|nr:hypothetical protein [Gandjariella thermophila]GDY34027.1 hypothetical protein GTS_56600 [Gandjariella thermophila]
MRRELREFLVHLRHLVNEIGAITLDLASDDMPYERQLALADRLVTLGQELRAIARTSDAAVIDGQIIAGQLDHEERP